MVMLTILLIKYHNSIRERTYLLRAAVVHPSLSPWRYLYDHEDDSSFLHLTRRNRPLSHGNSDVGYARFLMISSGERGKTKFLSNHIFNPFPPRCAFDARFGVYCI